MVKVYEPITSIAPVELFAEQRKEFGRIGAQRRIPGLTLFEYDLTTGEIREASVETEATLRMNGPIGRSGRVDAKQLCLYVQALNIENARRKFRAMTLRKTVQNKILKRTDSKSTNHGRKH